MRHSPRGEHRRHREGPGRGFQQFDRDREDSDERFEFQDQPRYGQRQDWPSSPYDTPNRQQGGSREGFGYSDQDRGQDFRSPQNMWNEGGQRGRGNYAMGDYGQSAQDFGGDYGRQARRGEFGEGRDWTQGGGDYFGYGSEQQGRGQGSYGMSDRSRGFGDWGQATGGSGSGPQRYGYGAQQIGRGGYGFGEQTGYDAGRGDWNRFAGGGQDPSQRRGPKGYARSDERLKEDVCERLMQEQDLDVGEVSIEVQNGKVTLEGTVPERRMKHRIEDVACSCMGVKDVENRVRISRGDSERGRDGDADGGSLSGGAGSSSSSYASKRKN